NGYSSKQILTDNDKLSLSVPRDRSGEYNPKIIPKHKKRFDGFDDKIISLYSRGLTTNEITGHLKDMYDISVSDSLISTVTNGVMDEVVQWQNRPLDEIYPIIYFDCIVVKCREDGRTVNKSVYLALAVNMDGQKELLGMWISLNEGAKFWLNVLTDLKNRGLNDIFIACIDGLKGFPEAIETVYPDTQVQLCIVHMIRNSLKYVSWKDRKALVADLKRIYRAATLQEAENNLDKFSDKWDKKYPTISKMWINNWERITPFFQYSEDIRKAIYTTNAIESINHSLRKIIKNRGAFPNDDAIFKILYLALKNISRRWTMPIKNWKSALNQFAIKFENRFPL
ncbi:MAG: IS256 family transposase, partial [PVC group bacterium]|nr:IS256 family transposase [PVC group bacterium]